MAFHKALDPGSVNGWKGNVASAMKKLAAGRQCPSCGRSGEMGAWRHFIAERVMARRCRYCGHEQARSF